MSVTAAAYAFCRRRVLHGSAVFSAPLSFANLPLLVTKKTHAIRKLRFGLD
jgi:hypothetical protein